MYLLHNYNILCLCIYLFIHIIDNLFIPRANAWVDKTILFNCNPDLEFESSLRGFSVSFKKCWRSMKFYFFPKDSWNILKGSRKSPEGPQNVLKDH